MNASMLSEKIIGKTLKEVERICKKNSVKCRISDEDGKPIMGTCDFKPDRLNTGTKDIALNWFETLTSKTWPSPKLYYLTYSPISSQLC